MNSPVIRQAVLQDAQQMAELDRICFSVPWSLESFVQELSVNERAMYFVAEIDGQLAGYAGLWQIVDEGHITNVAVAPQFRRQKLATAILEAFLSEGRARGIRAFTLEVRASNIAAQELYRKFGFQSAGERPGYYEDNKEAAMIMWLAE